MALDKYSANFLFILWKRKKIQVQTGILAVMIRKERQSQEMTVFCLQGTVFMGGKREIRSRRRVQSEATPSRSPHSKSLKKEALRPRTPI